MCHCAKILEKHGGQHFFQRGTRTCVSSAIVPVQLAIVHGLRILTTTPNAIIIPIHPKATAKLLGAGGLERSV